MNSFGRIFRISIYGESHGKSVGVLIDGCPPGIALSEADFEKDISKRKSGEKGTTAREETDKPILQNGVFKGFTNGAPLHIMFENKNVISKDYEDIKDIPRPGHADFVAHHKYKGFHDYRGGGHFSGRLTLALVAAGVVAKKIIKAIKIDAQVIEIGGYNFFEQILDKTIKEGDSIGGIVECRAQNVPVGLGEPFFDSMESQISHLAFAIPGIKGIEFGAGFTAAKMKASVHNDLILEDGATETNNAGGINGGISNGNELVFRVAVKPTSSISKTQHTLNISNNKRVDLQIKGRHDACIALRVPVVLEAIAAIAMADFSLISKSYQ